MQMLHKTYFPSKHACWFQTPPKTEFQLYYVLTINSNWKKNTHYLLFWRHLCHPSEFKGVKKNHCHEKSIRQKERKIANISCLKISIFRFSWSTSQRIPNQWRKSWRKTSHTSPADFLHKPMQLQTLKEAKLLSILSEPISDFRISGYIDNFSKNECISKIVVTLMYYPDFPVSLPFSLFHSHFSSYKMHIGLFFLVPESGLALKCISISQHRLLSLHLESH